jgi:hypothetical protein
MPIRHLLDASTSKALQKYNAKIDRQELFTRFVSFSGVPRKHPNDSSRILLISDPFSLHTSYYEFIAEDIVYAEEINTVVTPDGKTATMVRIWVRRGSIGVHCTPFQVEDTTR